MEIEQFGRYNAVVEYHRTDDLKAKTPDNKQNVIVEACWVADNGEDFEGDWIFKVLDENLQWHRKYPYWLPERDLNIVSVL
jgi:hypothetical protein